MESNSCPVSGGHSLYSWSTCYLDSLSAVGKTWSTPRCRHSIGSFVRHASFLCHGCDAIFERWTYFLYFVLSNAIPFAWMLWNTAVFLMHDRRLNVCWGTYFGFSTFCLETDLGCRLLFEICAMRYLAFCRKDVSYPVYTTAVVL